MVLSLVDRLLESSVIGSYSKIGIAWRKRSYTRFDVDMRGRTVVLTGASSGLGLAAARAVRDLGATVVCVVRDVDKARAALGQPSSMLSFVCADLSNLDDVRRAAKQIVVEHTRVHALVNNAGLLPLQREQTAQRHERAFATNVLAGFLLTRLLRPVLEATGTADDPARVVTMSSGGMYTQRIDLQKLQSVDSKKFDGIVAYAQTKRAQVMLNRLWQRRFDARVVCAAMHPGWAETPGVSTSLPIFNRVMAPLLRTPADGADTLVWLLASTEPLAHLRAGHRFFHDRAPRTEHLKNSTRENDVDDASLWALCEELTQP
jgi:dehydrogenase/reductase SDR family member 12